MLITARPLLLIMSVITAAIGAIIWFIPVSRWMGLVVVGCAAINGIALLIFSAPSGRASGGKREPDDISGLTQQRCRELVRGTSLYLRELRYRYSIRIDPHQTSEQRCFTAEVNSVKLGFVPVVIIDNTNDRQGLGYVAFVHDGKRWRGPGLPCPAGQVEAVRHAAKCVSPLAKEEETRF